MGRKKILFGSIFVLALIILMPSIPAIEQKTIENQAYSDFIEKLDGIDLEDIEKLEWTRHPILYTFYMITCFIMYLRMIRIEKTWDIGYEIFYHLYNLSPESDINELIFLLWARRMTIMFLVSSIWINYWLFLSEILRWNWYPPPWP